MVYSHFGNMLPNIFLLFGKEKKLPVLQTIKSYL